MHVNVYGLSNCDSTKAAMKWLKQNDIAFNFHDFKEKGVTSAMITQWITQVSQDKLLNKKSTTWRALTKEDQEKATSIAGSIELMQDHPNLIKRPIIEWPSRSITVGYDNNMFETQLSLSTIS